MLDLDKIVLNELLRPIVITGKQIADIGCGTGRHWADILQKEPSELTGFDVSPGMLKKLKDKFPTADAKMITNNHFSDVANGSFDMIISTLTMAHIENIHEALAAWGRIMKTEGDIIITDFHPDALAAGGQRTFKYQNKPVAVKNFVHTTAAIKQVLLKENFTLINDREIKVDETVKHYYSAQNALHVYEKFKGSPIIYGLHFRRG
jgi:ubiquinone/menaquinone biosynthesis C-methylase UbiE